MGIYCPVKTNIIIGRSFSSRQENGGSKMNTQQTQQSQQNQQTKTKIIDVFRFGWTKFKLWRSGRRSNVNANIMKSFVLLAIVMLAYREGLFDLAPGVKDFIEIWFNIISELYGFLADLLTKVYELLNIESIWHFIRSLVK